MPIQKNKVVSSGVSGNYWVTKQIQISPDYSFIRAFSYLYTSKAAYVSGDASIFEEDVIVTSNPVTPAAVANLLEVFLVGGSSGFPDFSGGSVVS